MAKIFAAAVNPLYPRSFDEFCILNDFYLQAADRLLGSEQADAKIAFFPEYWVHRTDEEFFGLQKNFRDYKKGSLDIIFSGRRPVPLESEEVEAMKQSAVEHGFYVSSGWIEKDGSHNYLSSLLVEPDGSIPVWQRKINPIEKEVASWGLRKGNKVEIYKGKQFTLGWLVCADIWHPELSRELFENGVDIVHHPKGFDFNDEEFGPLAEKWKEREKKIAGRIGAYLVSDTNFLARGEAEAAVAQIVNPRGTVLKSNLKGGIISATVEIKRDS